MNLLNATVLHDLIKPELPADQQTDAIEAFFTDENFEAMGLENDGSDISGIFAMDGYLASADNISDEVNAMIGSWKKNGF